MRKLVNSCVLPTLKYYARDNRILRQYYKNIKHNSDDDNDNNNNNNNHNYNNKGRWYSRYNNKILCADATISYRAVTHVVPVTGVAAESGPHGKRMRLLR